MLIKISDESGIAKRGRMLKIYDNDEPESPSKGACMIDRNRQ